MNQVDIILEQFKLDPLFDLTNIDPKLYFSENVNNDIIYQIYNEASNPTTKKNIFERIFDILKKAWNWVCTQAKKLWNWIQVKLKRNEKSIDQIASSVTTERNTQKIISTFSLPSNPRSNVKHPDIDIIYKPFLTKFHDDGKTVTISPMTMGIKAGSIPAKNILQFSYLWSAFLLIIKPELLDALMKCVEFIEMNNFESSEFVKSVEYYLKLRNSKENTTKEAYSEGFDITLDQLMEFTKKINDINERVQKIDQPKIDAIKASGDANKALYQLNNIAGQIDSIQLGINGIARTIGGSYLIDPSFCDTIKSVEKLDYFVKQCIDSGIPSKYISYNAYLISHPDIKGDGSKGDQNNPVWGESRVVFYPLHNETIVHKIALSGWGLRANKSEIVISNAFEKYGDTKSLAMIINSAPHNCVVDAERVDTKAEADYVDSMKLIDHVKQFCSKHNIPLDLTVDVNAFSGHNLGVKNGKPAIIDYGLLSRTSIAKT